LKAVAAGLKTECREYDYVARMGGDEFVVILPGAKPTDAAHAAQRFQQMVAVTCEELFAEQLLTASIGVANFPSDGTDAEKLLAEADRRMYQEKRERKQAPAAPAAPATRRADKKKTWDTPWTTTVQ